MVDPSQAVQLTQTFDPFGQVLEQAGSAQSSFGYTGEQTDPTDLVYLRARYYDPALGRFLTADSIIPDPLSSQGWNRYAYVENNPVNYIDPSGHAECWDAECEYLVNPKTKDFIDKGVELVKSTFWPLPGSTEFATKQPAPINVDLSRRFHEVGLAADVTELAISTGGFAIELLLGTAVALGVPTVGDEPLTFTGGYLLGVTFYQPLDKAGEGIGGVGLFSTIAGDYFGSEIYPCDEGLVVPSTTQIGVVTTLLGLSIPEAGLDMIVDSHILNRIKGIPIGALKFYPDLEKYFPTRVIGGSTPKSDNE